MTDPTALLFFGLGYLLIKHLAADFLLQTRYQWSNKGIYGHPGGLLHAGIHATLSAPVLAILPPSSMLFAIALLAGEFVLHYHIDWTKEQIVKRAEWTPSDTGFWMTLGVDQFAHHLTYLAMVAVLVWR